MKFIIKFFIILNHSFLFNEEGIQLALINGAISKIKREYQNTGEGLPPSPIVSLYEIKRETKPVSS